MPCPPDPEEIEQLKLDSAYARTKAMADRVDVQLPALEALLDALGTMHPGVVAARAALAGARREDAPIGLMRRADLPGQVAYQEWFGASVVRRTAALCAARCALFGANRAQVSDPSTRGWEQERDRHFEHRLEDLVSAQGLIHKRVVHWQKVAGKERAQRDRLMAMLPESRRDAAALSWNQRITAAEAKLARLAELEARWVALRDDPVALLCDPDPFAAPLP